MRHVIATLVLLIGLSMTGSGLSAGFPQAGSTLPDFTFPPVENTEDLGYLGLKSGESVLLRQLNTPFLLVEIIGVYCAQCRTQLPDFNKLHKRLQKGEMASRIKMLAIASGATPMEIEYLRKKDYNFPILRDQEFEFAKLSGIVKTPFTLVMKKDGEILFTHLGVIEDVDGFFKDIQRMVK